MPRQGGSGVILSMTDLFEPRRTRTEILFVRVTEEEQLAISKAAADAGIPSVADFMRQAAREKILELQERAKRKKKPR